MKTCQEIAGSLPRRLKKFLVFDEREIDNPDPYHHGRLNYLDRLQIIVKLILARYQPSQTINIADIGCAQGNLSILLAEKGFAVTAVDIDPDYLAYAKLKQTSGSINWVQGNFDQLDLNNKFDVLILGEIIEHCAYPEDFIQKAQNYLKPNGLMVVTTPNASMFRNHLPTFGQLRHRADRKFLEERQFGPDGDDHLFLFTLNDLKLILKPPMRLEKKGYLGGSVLINRRTTFLLHFFPNRWLLGLERLIANLPIVNKYTCHGLVAILRLDE